MVEINSTDPRPGRALTQHVDPELRLRGLGQVVVDGEAAVPGHSGSQHSWALFAEISQLQEICKKVVNSN